MFRSVRMLAFCVLLGAGPHALANGIHEGPADLSAKHLCCTSAADRQAINLAAPRIYTEWSSPAQPAPIWTIDDPEVRSHGPSWTFFLIAIILFITAKTMLLFRPVHRAGRAYARLYWDVFSPLEF